MNKTHKFGHNTFYDNNHADTYRNHYGSYSRYIPSKRFHSGVDGHYGYSQKRDRNGHTGIMITMAIEVLAQKIFEFPSGQIEELNT